MEGFEQSESYMSRQRKEFHEKLLREGLLQITNKKGIEYVTNSDADNEKSVEIGMRIYDKIVEKVGKVHGLDKKLSAQTLGNRYEIICAGFIGNIFLRLMNSGSSQEWSVEHVTTRGRAEIANYKQYRHLETLAKISKENGELAASLGNDYMVIPDIVIKRRCEKALYKIEMQGEDGKKYLFLKENEPLCKNASLRLKEEEEFILHASISCKWTIRSDRAQNSRSEALNLLRNRKGRAPHIVVVTAEPTPSRLSSIALGTGDIDCVYHFALYELMETLEEMDKERGGTYSSVRKDLDIMVNGDRLKDISDLPVDLLV